MIFAYIFLAFLFVALILLAFAPFILSGNISEEERKRGIDN